MFKFTKVKNGKNIKKILSVVSTLALDMIFCVAAFWIAYGVLFSAVKPPENFIKYLPLINFNFVVISLAMHLVFDCYSTMWRYAGRIDLFKIIFANLASLLLFAILNIILYPFLGTQIWASFILLYLMFVFIFNGGHRFIFSISHYLMHLRNKVAVNPQGLKRTIVIGAAFTGTLAISRFISIPDDGFLPVAILDDDEEKIGKKIYGIEVEGRVEDLPKIVAKYDAQMVVIAITSLSKSDLRRIYGICTKCNIPVKLIPGVINVENNAAPNLEMRDIRIEELLGRDEFMIKQEFIDASIKDKVVCITGGAGSIGSELCRQALTYGCKHLVIFDIHENGMFFFDQELSAAFDTTRYSLVIGSVRDKQKIAETLSKYKVDIVFHAAAYKHVPMMEINGCEAIKNNVEGTRNLIEECENHNVQKLILISTDKAVNPANIMGASKRIAEMLIQTYGKKSKTKMAAVRFGNVLGSNGSVIPIFLQQIKQGGPITLTDRNIQRYFMTIPEAVRLVLQTGALADSGEVFVLDMGEPVKIYDLACDLIRLSGLKPEIDIPIKITGLRAGEKMFEELRFDDESVNTTSHEGIFINKLSDINIKEFNDNLTQVLDAAYSNNTKTTVDKIFEIVPSIYRAK